MRLSAWLIASASLLTSACTVGPNYTSPLTPAPPAFEEAVSTKALTLASTAPDVERWWRAFNDPVLDALVEEALAGNPDLAAAAARVRAARQQIRIAAAAELPTLSASGAAVTFNTNRGGSGSAAAGAGTAAVGAAGAAGTSAAAGAASLPLPGHLNLYSVGFDASWELDLFGGVRRSIEEAKDSAEANEWARRDGEVSLTAEVVNDYLVLRALQLRIGILNDEIRSETGLFKLVQARRATGFVTNLDVNQQRVALESADAELPALQAQVRAEMHGLDVLVGRSPGALEGRLTGPGGLPSPPSALSVGLPSELLRRRPDVRQAERRLAAANAEIGVEVAKLFPSVDLLGLGSFAGASLTDLFSHQNLQSAALGSLSQPLFNGGRTRAAIRAAKEAREEAYLAYQKAVLGAFRDVEDALVRYRADIDRAGAVSRSLAASENSLAIAKAEYQVGQVTFINVLQSETSVLQTRDELAQSRASELSDVAALYKALGGGWTTTITPQRRAAADER